MPENVLICGTNWLGDSIMSMPAIQRFREKFPSCRITMLVKPQLIDLWGLHPCVDGAATMLEGVSGAFKTAGRLAECCFDTAFIFPNSFRSALVPFLAGVHSRQGFAGHQRRWMLTEVVYPPEHADRMHQAWEYLEIMDVANDWHGPLIPRLNVPETGVARAKDLLGPGKYKGWIGLMPGAAYGPAKRWPAEYFAEVGKTLGKSGYGLLVMGSGVEADLCAGVAGSIGQNALNLAGRTSIPELAAMLGLCRVVVTNDSGGMHLAAATGTSVVAVFGITDPSKTGPLGQRCRVIFDEGVNRSRDIERSSSEAEASLRSIKPQRIIEAVESLLQGE